MRPKTNGLISSRALFDQGQLLLHTRGCHIISILCQLLKRHRVMWVQQDVFIHLNARLHCQWCLWCDVVRSYCLLYSHPQHFMCAG